MNHYTKKSTNGRWGIALVGDMTDVQLQGVIQGTIQHLGAVNGVDTWQVTPGSTGEYYWLAGDIEAVAGAVILAQRDLQSGDVATLVRMNDEAVLNVFGYKRRSARFVAVIEGTTQDIPAPILLAMGLVKGTEAKAEAELPKPEPLKGAMASAFAKLRA